MDSLIYSLNATVPVFVVIVVGYLLKRIGWINQGFIEASNKINFKVTLPALLIQDMVNNNFMEKFELGYVIFCAVATTISILTMWFLARIFMKDKSIIGEFVQASYRSSAAVLGAAFILNIYSDTGMVPLNNSYSGMSRKRCRSVKNFVINVKGNSYKPYYFKYCCRGYFVSA